MAAAGLSKSSKKPVLFNLKVHAPDIKFWTTTSAATRIADLKRVVDQICLDNGVTFSCSQLQDGAGYVLPDEMSVGALLRDGDVLTAVTRAEGAGETPTTGALHALLTQFESCAKAAAIYVAHAPPAVEVRREADGSATGAPPPGEAPVPLAGLVMASCFLHSPDKKLVRAALIALDSFSASSESFCVEFCVTSGAVGQLCMLARDPETPHDAVTQVATILSRLQRCGALNLDNGDAANVVQTFVFLAARETALSAAGAAGNLAAATAGLTTPALPIGKLHRKDTQGSGAPSPPPASGAFAGQQVERGADGSDGMVREMSLTALAREHARAASLRSDGNVQFDFAMLAKVKGKGGASIEEQAGWLVALLKSEHAEVRWFAVAGLEQVPDIGITVRALQRSDTQTGIADLLLACSDEHGAEFHEAAEGADGRGSRVGHALLRVAEQPAGERTATEGGYAAGSATDAVRSLHLDDHGRAIATAVGGAGGTDSRRRTQAASVPPKRWGRGSGVSPGAAAAQLAATALMARLVRTEAGLDLVNAAVDSVVGWLCDRFRKDMPDSSRDGAERCLVTLFGDKRSKFLPLASLLRLARIPSASAMRAAARSFAAFASRDDDNEMGSRRVVAELMELASTDSIDVSLPAALALGQVALKERNKLLVLRQGGAVLFAELLGSGGEGDGDAPSDVRLQRVAAKALANLAQSNNESLAQVKTAVEEIAYKWRDIEDAVVMMYMKMFNES